MTSKWATVSFFGLGTLLAAGVAATGCSVSTGGINDDGGTGTVIPPSEDSGTTADTSTNACPGNVNEPANSFPAACQTALENACCSQLTTCFNIVPTESGKATTCGEYAACVDRCNFKADGTTACTTDADCTAVAGSACLTESDNTKKCHEPEPDDSLYTACTGDCDAITQTNVSDAFKALDSCKAADATSTAACGGQ